MSVPSPPCGAVVFDDGLRIVEANDYAARMLEYAVEDLVTKSLNDILGRDGTIFFNTHVNPSLAMHGRIDEVYVDLRTRTGERIPVIINGVRTAGEPVEGSRSTLAFLPMRRRQLFEHELIAARDAAVESARAEREALENAMAARARLAGRERLASLGTLAHGIAHEINNPLTIIMAGLDSLSEELSRGGDHEPAQLLELVLEAREGAQRILEITRQMGSLVRAEEMPRVPIDLRQVAKLVVRMTQVHTRARARVVVALEETPIVGADSGRLGQILINLVTNAVQAFGDRPSDQNEVRITTRTAADGMALVEVSDNGPGIPPDVAARIFEPFFTTKPVGEGTGLGLSISQSLVASLGGTLSFESTVGSGTTFRIALPPLTIPTTAPVAPEPSRRARVLVVDDDESVARVIARVLRRYDVTVALSPQEALACIQNGPRFDLVFSDLRMPGQDGLSLHAAIERLDPPLARSTAFITSAIGEAADAEIRQRGLPVFEKPINVAELLAFCERRLGRSEPAA